MKKFEKYQVGRFDNKIDRRSFMKAAGKYGLTVAMVAASGGSLTTAVLAQTAASEADKQAAADHIMTIGTAYVLGASETMPIMQQKLKENIETMSEGAIFVQLAPGGQLGTGSALAQSVQEGSIQAAQHSLSNFAPFAPVVDLINIPYWTGPNQNFINLVTSDVWKNNVNPKIAAKGFKALWYVATDPRTASVRKGKDVIKTPDDMRGIKFRVPGSEILAQFYRLLGANPTPVAWGETPAAIQQGVADALDPSEMALNIFGFGDILDWVTFNAPVPDSQVYSCNLEWFESLPGNLQEVVEMASEQTLRDNMEQIPVARQFAMDEMGAKGVQFYTPTDEELQQWVDTAGHQLDVWNDLKKDLAGSLAAFDELKEAAETNGDYVMGM